MANSKFFEKKNVLIVDDLADFRSAIKRMVEIFGAQSIEAAINGEDAIDQMSKQTFDIVLCDYNLGEGKDGQQVLEEGRFKGSLKASQVFILITAESTAEMVMGALEYEPDGYLVKPFNHDMLLARLEKIAVIKEDLKFIYLANEKKNYVKVIELCDVMINEGKHFDYCAKIKVSALVNSQQFQQAHEFLQSLAENERAPWIIMALGKVHFHLKKYAEAIKFFEEIIKLGPTYVEAYDWIAKSKIELGKPKEAQMILEKAVKISPKAILRQQALAEIALKNGDAESAEKALRTAVGIGKNSVYRKQEDYFNLADTLMTKAVDSSGLNGKRASDEALALMEGVSLIYNEEKDIQAKSAMYQGRALVVAGKPDRAKILMERASSIMEQHEVMLDPKDMLKFAKTYVDLGEKEKGEAIIKQVIINARDNEQLLSEVNLIAEEMHLVVDEKTLNKEGIRLFEVGKLKEAAELFEKAVLEMPNNMSVVLNAAQSYIQYMQKVGTNQTLFNKVKGFLTTAKIIEKTDKRYDRYQQLVKLYKDLAK